MQAFAYCISTYEDLPTIVLKSGWLPGLLKILTDVKANSVAEETRSCFLLLLTAIAKVDKSAKSVIREKGGLDLARYDSILVNINHLLTDCLWLSGYGWRIKIICHFVFKSATDDRMFIVR
ncbi:neurochondrin-like [Ruditapes philippinarum]|uniref:neurochondrin-like n=1 Tax=Ruditapes philippinarum TaxID=129788 RepID=UPI00295C362D|nr:neurochondrin-like [Ruditapes philippinarum]